MATPSEMKYTCAARPSTLGKCGSALLDDIVSISLRTSLRSVVNADAVTSAVSSTRNSVVGPPLSSSDFALSAACCHRVFPSEVLVFIVGEVSSTMTMRSFFPVSDSISGLASDNAISSAIVAAMTMETIRRSFSQSEWDSRSSSTRRHKIEDEIRTRRCRNLSRYNPMMIATVVAASSPA